MKFRERHSRDLFQCVAVRFEPRLRSHTLDGYYEKACEGSRVVLRRQFSLLLCSHKCLNKDRFNSSLVIAQEISYHCIFRVTL